MKIYVNRNISYIRMSCGKRAAKLCGECDVCIERSVSSHPKGSQYSTQNELQSKFVTQGSGKKCLWDCIDCPHTFPARPPDFLRHGTNGCKFCANRELCPKEKNCQICFNKSFASSERAKNVVDKSIDLTQKFLNCNEPCDFWCECSHKFPSTYENVSQGSWCLYCANKKLCAKEENCIICFNKSFASSERAHNVIDKTIDLHTIFISSGEECEFGCECGHTFTSTYHRVTKKHWCRFCANKDLCSKDKNCQLCFNKSFAFSDKAKNVVDKSIDLTQKFISCGEKCEFKCDKDHQPWITTYANVTAGHWCPHCINKTEAKILEWYRNTFKWPIIYQKTFDWCRNLKGYFLPFDMCIPELKLILEPDGEHHFKDIKGWKSKFKIVVARDVYKMKCAIEHGFTILRIDQIGVWNDTFDWRQMLFDRIRIYTNPMMKRIAEDKSIYDYHKELLKEALTED